jgi:hypothetical protein
VPLGERAVEQKPGRRPREEEDGSLLRDNVVSLCSDVWFACARAVWQQRADFVDGSSTVTCILSETLFHCRSISHQEVFHCLCGRSAIVAS